MGNDIIVKTTGLTKRYGHFTAVDSLDLEIAEGQSFGLLGPNGAGKTTTILMLMGLTGPTSGSVRVCGFNPVTEPLKVKRIVGYMPEKVGFYENLTAWENLDLIAQFNNISRKESLERGNELLKTVGLGEVTNKLVGQFSRGMKQRLGIADVLMKLPRVAIFDEPTAGLDPEGISHILEVLETLPAKGTTVVMCSHRLYEVEKICHSVGIFSEGKMVVSGPIAELSRIAKKGNRYQIEVEVGEPAEKLLDKVRRIQGVTDVTGEGQRIFIGAETDIRPEVSRVVVQSNVSLVGIKIQELTLDDIYLRYFHQDQEKAEK